MNCAAKYCIWPFLFFAVTTTLWAQKVNVPRYCKTDAGVLGPYPNDGSVGVGDPCYGTKNGQRYEGVAVMSKGGSEDDGAAGGEKKGGGRHQSSRQLSFLARD